MIINTGLGDIIDDSSPEASFNWNWLALGLGLIVLFQISHSKRVEGRAKRQLGIARRKTSSGSIRRTTLNETDNEVIQALVSQGASKSQAKGAVVKARQGGASGFDGLFRGALKELT